MDIIKETAEEKAYRVITESLLRKYRPGDYLYECVLAKTLKMSRTPVATALNRLVSEGLLCKQPKKGCFIPSVSLKDAKDVFAVRRVLEMEAIRLLIVTQNTSFLESLQSNLERQVFAVREDNFDDFYPIDLDFHRLLMISSGNEHLHSAWKRAFLRCNIYTGYFFNSLKENQSVAECLMQDHHEIYNAIKNNNLKKALDTMATHFDHITLYAIDNTMIYDDFS